MNSLSRSEDAAIAVMVKVSVPAPPSITSFVVNLPAILIVSLPLPPVTLTVETAPDASTVIFPVDALASTVPSIVVLLPVAAHTRAVEIFRS